jgi:hypothetical protein
VPNSYSPLRLFKYPSAGYVIAMHSSAQPGRPPWRGAAIGLLLIAGSLALAGWLGALSVGGGWVAGPDLRLRFGEYQLIARTTTRPECLPLTQHECFLSFPAAPSHAAPFYAVWAGRITFVPARGSEPQVTINSGRHLLKLQVGGR